MENIKNRWEMDNNAWNENIYSIYFIQEVEEDGETFFDVLNADGDQVEWFSNYQNAVEYVKDLWQIEKDEKEDEEYERLTAIPDSVESLGLTGLF